MAMLKNADGGSTRKISWSEPCGGTEVETYAEDYKIKM
jgi:hypothetical protein